MPNWKGFFSDPVVYQLPPEEFQVAYQKMAAADPQMANFTPEDHEAFFTKMSTNFNPQNRVNAAIGEGTTGGSVMDAFAPVAAAMASGELTPEMIGQQQAVDSVVDPVASALTVAEGLVPGQQIQNALNEPWARGLVESVLNMGRTGAGAIGAVAELLNKGIPGGPAEALGQKVQGVADTAVEGVNFGGQVNQELMTKLFGPDSQKRITEILSKDGDLKDAPEWAYDSLAQLGVSMLPYFINPGAGLLNTYAQETGEKMRQVDAGGGEMSEAVGLAAGTIPAAMERLGIGKLMKAIPGGEKALSRVLEKLITEAGTEYGQELFGTGLVAASKGEDVIKALGTKEAQLGGLEAAAAGALGGGAVGGGQAIVGRQQSQIEEALKIAGEKEKDVRELMNQGATVEEAFGQLGIGDLAPSVRPDVRDVRFEKASQSMPYLTESELQQVVTDEGRGQIDIASIAAREGLEEDAVRQALDTVEQEAQATANPPDQEAAPTEDNEAVVAAIAGGLNAAADKAEADGNMALAQRRREAAKQVKVIEPTERWQRTIQGVSQLGSAPKLVFYTQPQEDAQHGGVFVRQGLIAVDVSRGKENEILPRAVLGTVMHEMVHNQQEANPEAYKGAMMTLKNTQLWRDSKADLETIQNAVINDDEILAHMMEMPDVVPELMRTLADRTKTEKLAKAPGPIRALYEWLAKTFDRVAAKFGITDVSAKRDRAQAILDMVDLIQAGDANMPVKTAGEPKFAVTTERFAKDEPKDSPRLQHVLSLEMDAFSAAFAREELKIRDYIERGMTPEQARQKVFDRAVDVVRVGSEVLERPDYSPEMSLYADFAKSVGIEVHYYESADTNTKGFTSAPGQLWINAGAFDEQYPVEAIVAHEMMHDLRKRDREAWDAAKEFARTETPEEWGRAEAIVGKAYGPLDEDQFENEVFSHVIHLHADSFWAAVAEVGKESKSKPAFKRFLDWVQQLYNKIRTELDISNPNDRVGLAAASAVRDSLAPDDGAEFTAHEPGRARIVQKMIKETVKTGMKEQPDNYAVQFANQRVKELKFSPKRRSGYPEPAQTPQGLGVWRRKLEALARRGGAGRYWYEESSTAILGMVGGDLRLAGKFARLLAVYSPQKNVMSNWHAALAAWQKYMSGYSRDEFLKESIGFPKMHSKAAGILYDDAQWEGEKTNNFFTNLLRMIDNKAPQGVTIDLWMMRAMGFSGDVPTEAQYKEMAKEVKRAAKVLDVEPYQAQAMIWVYAKTVWESKHVNDRVKKRAEKAGVEHYIPVLNEDGTVKKDRRGKPVTKVNPPWDQIHREEFHKAIKDDLKSDLAKYPISAEAMTTFATGLKRRVGYLSQEAVPGDSSGALRGIIDADLGTKAEFTMDIEHAMLDENGNDVIGQLLGMAPTGDVNNMLMEPSAYVNNNGELEVNPARQIEVPVAAKSGAESRKTLEAGGLELMKLYAVLRGAFTSQESVAGYRPFETVLVKDRNMVTLDRGRTFTEDEVKALVSHLDKKLDGNGWKVALYPTENGINALYVSDDKTNKQFHEFMNEVAKTLGIGKVSTFGAETFYVPMEDEYGGEGYADVLEGYDEVIRKVEDRVADQLASVYQKYADQGFGEVPAWVEDRSQAPWRVKKGEATIGDLKKEAQHIIEVDYREHGKIKGIDLSDEVLGGIDRPAAQYIASLLAPEEDSYAIFPADTELGPLRQAFTTVRSTPVGLLARGPRIPSITSRTIDLPVPESKMDKVEPDAKFSSVTRDRGWNMPTFTRWNKFVKKVQDSFIRFKTLNQVLEDQGVMIRDAINVRLQEELYHGRVQTETEKVYTKYINPLMAEMRGFSQTREETHEEILAKFDKYLHARHAKERNKHIREAWMVRKKARLLEKRDVIQGNLNDLNTELKDEAKTEHHILRVKDSIKYWEKRLAKIEAQIEKVNNQPELNSGMSDEESDRVMKRSREDGLLDTFSRWGKQFVDPILTERLKMMLDEGLITKAEYDNVNQYKWYVPLKGTGLEAGDVDEILENLHDFGQGAGFDIRGQELPFVVGRKDRAPVNPILAQVVVDSMSAIDRVERNKVANALLTLAEENPNKKLWEINRRVKKRVFDKRTGEIKSVNDWWSNNKDNVIAAKRDGQTYFITLYDGAMVEAMKGLGVENLWKWVRSVRVVMRTLAQLYTTWSPEFILTNFTRDWQQAIVSATTDMGKEAAMRVARNSSKAVRGIMAANFPDKFGRFKNEYTDAYQELKDEGGKVGFFGMQGIEDTQRKILQEMRTDPQIRTLRGVRAVGELVSRVNEATENGIRLATYVEAKRAGLTKQQAASLAKNVSVNFNRRGDIGGAIGAFYLFFNAGAQGVDRFFKSMKTPAGAKLAAAYTAIGFATSIFSRAMMGEDDDGEDLYEKISGWTNHRHWIIANPFNPGEFLQIPMPYGYGIFGQLGKELENMVFNDDDPLEKSREAAGRMLGGLTTHFSPIGETSFDKGWYAMARPVVPTLIEPFTDVAVNETYWGGKVYPSASPWDRRASSHRVFPPKTLTDKIVQRLTQGLNSLTGGSAYRPGVIDLNADGLTYLLDSYIGPTGNFLKRPFDLIQKKALGERTTWNDWIIIRRFLSETAPEYYVPGEFYDAIDDIRRSVDERRWMKTNGASAEDMRRWATRHGWKVHLDKAARDSQEKVRDLRDRGLDEEALKVQRGFVSAYLRSHPQ